MKNYFWDNCSLPNVVGVIDGTHIPVRVKDTMKEEYFCYKGFTSLNA